MEAAAKSNLKKVSLELGGKSPLIVMDDVDCKLNFLLYQSYNNSFLSFTVDEAVQIAQEAVFINSGQICCAGSRTFVHEKIYDEFVKKSVALAKKRIVGCPFAKDTQQGPQIDDEMYTKVLNYIEYGKKDGAKLETGGKKIPGDGFFIEPTV